MYTFREGYGGFISEFYLSGFVIEIFRCRGQEGQREVLEYLENPEYL